MLIYSQVTLKHRKVREFLNAEILCLYVQRLKVDLSRSIVMNNEIVGRDNKTHVPRIRQESYLRLKYSEIPRK